MAGHLADGPTNNVNAFEKVKFGFVLEHMDR